MKVEQTDVVEIDAIAVEEWDREQHTPVQVESNLAELVKKSGLDEAWEAGAKDEPASAAADKPRTTANTMRRTGSAPAMPSKVHKTMALPTVAVVKPAAPAKAAPAASAAADPAQPKAKLEAKTAPAKSATKATASRVALAKPGAAPTFSPFGNEAATPAAPVAKADAKSAPVAAKPAPPVAKTETTKSAPIARPPAMPDAKPARADATPAKAAPIATPPVTATKPARPDGTPAKAAPVATPAANVSATKPARTDATPAPAVAKPAPVAMPEASKGDALAAKLASTPSDATARAPSTLDLPAWPPAATPRAITSEPTPRMEVAHLAAAGQQPEDWDELGGATSVGNRAQPPRKPGEDSVIVDLNAVAKSEHQPSRRPQTYPILTSDQGTTTSGAFEMPTAAQSMAAQPVAPPPSQRSERPTSPAMPAAAMTASPAVPASNNAAVSSTAWHTPLPLAAPPPEPAPQWPSAAGLDYNGAHGSAPEIPLPVARQEPTDPHLVRRTLLATVFPTPTSRKRGLLAAAGAIAVILVIVLVASGGSSKSTTDAKPSRATSSASSTTASPTAAQAATPAKPAAATSAATTTAAAATTVATGDNASSSPTSTLDPAKKKPVVAKRRISRGKKPIVVDYDKKPDPTPEQDEALTRARADYATGNRHLFAGETDAAIASYRQALAAYPNYVAGYRGLGLAYAQQGNKASALLAFKTYVKLAPAAKDVALIDKRIRSLSLN